MRIEGLTDVEIVALGKVAGKPANREAVAAGEYPVSFAVTIKGELKVGEDCDAKIAPAVPWQRIAMILLSKVNAATRRSTVALALDEKTVLADEIKSEAQAIANELLDDTIQNRKGAVRAELVAERVEIVKPALMKVEPAAKGAAAKRRA